MHGHTVARPIIDVVATSALAEPEHASHEDGCKGRSGMPRDVSSTLSALASCRHSDDHSDCGSDRDGDNRPSSPEQDKTEERQFTVCGRPLHLTLVRTYRAPIGVDWRARTMEKSMFGMVYKDQVVSDQFLIFFRRSLVSSVASVTYAIGMTLAAAVPLFSRRFLELWLSCSALLLLCAAVDSWVHVLQPLTPFYAKVRMAVSFVICLDLVACASWSMWSVQAHCEEADVFPHYPGRKTFVDTADLLQHCRTFIEPMPIVAAWLSVGAGLHPILYMPLMVLFLFLTVFVGRQYADVHEPASEQLVKFASLALLAVSTSGMSALQLFTARSAFEATIHIESQRQEAARRAAELEHLLATIVPAAVLPRLLEGGDGQFTIDKVECASMLFADMKGFTAWSSSRSAEAVTSMLNTVVAALDALAVRTEAVEKVKTVGDAYWAVSGIPVEAQNHADQLVLFGWRMNQIVAVLNQSHAEWDDVAWRVGIHSGPMTGALFGERQVSYEVFGETSHIAQVVEANGVPGALCVTQAVLDALCEPPPGLAPRHHRALDGVLPHDQVLSLFELASPHGLQHLALTSHDDVATLGPHSVGDEPSAASITAPSQYSQRSKRSSRRSSSASSAALVLNQHRRMLYRQRASTPATPTQRAASLPPEKRVSTRAATDGAVRESPDADNNVAAEDGVQMERTKWRFLPWFADDALEAAFKARCEIVTRPHVRAAAVMSIAAHALSMGAGFGEATPCHTTLSLVLQSAAALMFLIVLSLALHPKGSLAVAVGIHFMAMSSSVIGLGIAALGGCYFAHDVMWLCFFFVVPTAFAVGPVSWPVFAVCTWVLLLLPGLMLSFLYAPTGPSNPILCGLGTMILSTCVVAVEEGSLRRRFIEEELSQRCERQLQALGEERVLVLERLVPSHVVVDLIEWFGTGMDPLRSIAKTYDRVVVAFLQLRPEEPESLPRLHAAIDRDLDAANRDAASLLLTAPDNDTTDVIRDKDATAAVLLDKIKTVGDIVMLAGPFGHDDPTTINCPENDCDSVTGVSSPPPSTSVAAAFAAVVALARAVRPRCPLRLGAHVGPVVGTVQGSSRLAFDTFGDAVNVASRVMSSAPTCTDATAVGEESSSALRVSSELRDAIVASQVEVSFGGSVTVQAKGKGSLTVFPFSCSGCC